MQVLVKMGLTLFFWGGITNICGDSPPLHILKRSGPVTVLLGFVGRALNFCHSNCLQMY